MNILPALGQKPLIPTMAGKNSKRWSPLSVWCGAVHFSLE